MRLCAMKCWRFSRSEEGFQDAMGVGADLILLTVSPHSSSYSIRYGEDEPDYG